MKKFLLLISALLLTTAPFARGKQSTDAVIDLVGRIIPNHVSNITFELQGGASSNWYEFKASDGKLSVKGDCVNSLAMGLGDYLRDYCNVAVTWFVNDKIISPKRLPSTEGIVRREALAPNRFFFNYCTFGYTIGWWNWTQWERLIDWMALNGVTMALANTGQESVWQKVWMDMGLTAEQTREYFPGPSFLSWHRMTNIEGWHGPLPQEWLDKQEALQKQIIAREVSLGIAPILGSFTGRVPRSLKALFPNAEIRKLRAWGSFDVQYNPWYLSPTDPLYSEIQKKYLKVQKEMFGQDCHIYGIDIFNEVDPPVWDAEFLGEVAAETWKALEECDPDAVWLQMSWLFFHKSQQWTPQLIEAYLSPVPKGRLLMLDYYCDRVELYRKTDNFYGQDFIWCYLGNFGGNTMISGNVKDLSAKLDKVFDDSKGNCTGVGCTLESLDVNDHTYEYVLGRAWQKTVCDSVWYERLADRRLGFADASYRKAWYIMYDKVQKQLGGHFVPVLTARPVYNGYGLWNNYMKSYSNCDLLEAWGKVIDAKPSKSAGYEFDCVNMARQCLENYYSDIYLELIAKYKAGDKTAFKEASGYLLGIIDDLEKLVGSVRYFRLGRWIEEARYWGDTPELKDYYEWDAKDLVSCWGFKGGKLTDYSNRGWAGLYSTFYKPRWEEYFNRLNNEENFDYEAFKSWCEDFEWNWIGEDTKYSSKPKGNPRTLSAAMYKKYKEGIIARNE